MNNVLLIGRYHSLTKASKESYTLALVVSDKDGNFTLPIVVPNTIVKYILECCHEDDLFGIKESMGLIITPFVLLLTNCLFSLKRHKMYLIRGDYKSGYLYYVDTAFLDHSPYVTYSFDREHKMTIKNHRLALSILEDIHI